MTRLCASGRRGRTTLTDLARGGDEEPTGFIDQRRMELDRSRDRLSAAADALISGDKNRFVRLAAKIDALSPLKVLARGYSIALDGEGGAVKSGAALKAGDTLTLRLAEGGADVAVRKAWRDDNG